jgi:hypothetical protein
MQELARAGRPGGQTSAPGHQGDGLEIPPLIQATLDQEIRAMSPAAQRLLHAAAVVGEPFDVDLAAEIGALGHRDAATAIDELVSRSTNRSVTGRDARPTIVPRWCWRRGARIYRSAPTISNAVAP